MGCGQADRVSDFWLDVVGDVLAHRSACRPRSTLERLNERDQSVSLERKDEVRERRALQSRRKEGTLALGGPVNYQRATERKWKRCAESSILQGGGRDDRERGHAVARHSGHLFNGCREQNLVLESQQSLRETLEKRSIPTNQNYSSHLWYRLLNQPSLNLSQSPSRISTTFVREVSPDTIARTAPSHQSEQHGLDDAEKEVSQYRRHVQPAETGNDPP